MVKPINGMRGAVVVWLISYVFFLLTLANNFSASHDSINYLAGIVNGQHLFHPHHLLYHYYAHLWLLLFKNIFPGVPHYYLIESFTAVWGSGILAVCYLFFRNRFNLTHGLSALAIPLLAFSYGTWFYSVNIEVYAPPIFFILCSLFIITKKQPVDSDVWKVAILQSFAILFHQVNILFTPIVIYWLFVNRARLNFTGSFLRYAVLGLILTGGLYVFCGMFFEHKTNLTAFTEWILGYTKGHSYWQPLSSKTPLNVITGFSRAFVGGQFIFQHAYLEHILKNSFSSHGLRDEAFLASGMSPFIIWLLTIVTILFALLMIILVIRFIIHYRRMELHYHVINPVFLTIIVYSVFFCFWMPEILEFWILQMVLVWLLLIGMMPAYRFPFNIRALKGIFLLSVSLFIVNYFGSIRWLQRNSRDWYYVEIRKLDPDLTSSDIVYVVDEWILKDYVRYFSKATVIATDDPGYNEAEAQKQVREALSNHHKVIVYNRQVDPQWRTIRSD
jgi:hypothetical protein